jgi:hypothetical protein
MSWLGDRSGSPVFSDLLPYLSADRGEDILWLKDGSATHTFELIPKTASGLTDDELEALRFGLTPLLDQVPDDALIQVLVLRERTDEQGDVAVSRWRSTHLEGTPEGTAPTPRMRLFEAKRELLESLWRAKLVYQTKIYITLRIPNDSKPRPGARQGPLSHIAFLKHATRRTLKSQAEVLSELHQSVTNLRTGLESRGFETRDVSLETRVRLIYQFLNPERSRVMDAPSPTGEQDLSTRVTLTDFLESEKGLRLGRTSVMIGSLKSLPEITVPALAESLSSHPGSFALVVTVLFLPQTSERDRLLRKQRMAQGMASGNTVRNILAESQLRDIEDTLSAMISSGQKLVSASFHLISFPEGP